nr:unnamed protein product [Digitaria exilis]
MESSAAPSRGPASFLTQANALLRKNLCFQKRNLKTNIGITIFPVLLCVILVVLQGVIDSELDKPKYRCGCACVDPGPTAVGAACRRTECGIQYSTLDQVGSCPIPSPTPWPALVQLPRPESRAVMTAGQPFDGLPDPTCRDTGTCPGTVLFTGNNRSLAESILFYGVPFYVMYLLAINNSTSQFIINIFPDLVDYVVLTIFISTDVDCIQGLLLWRESASVVNDELFKGYRQQAGGTGGGKTNEFVAGYDFLNTNRNGLEINIWYNSTYNNNTGFGSIALLRVPRLVNTASNAYIKFLRGTGVEMLLEYVKEMPKVGTQPKFDLSSLLGPLFFTWIVQLLFPVSQQKLKIMMKMHGLKDGPYWLITYAYFVALSAIYMILLLIFGSLIGLNFFRTNAYSIQIVFYFIYINLQIALAFFVASFFSTVKLATVVGYIYVFGSGLLGNFLLGFFIEDTHFPKGWIVVMEIIPGFSLYRGLYEFGEYAFAGNAMGTDGMKWTNLDDPVNGMRSVLIIMVVEWAILLPLAFYVDRVSSMGGGFQKNPLFFLKYFKKRAPSFRRYSFGRQGSQVVVEMDNPDVAQEREVVEQLLLEPIANQAILSDNLRKVYHGKDGNPDKLAVQGLSLAIPKVYCCSAISDQAFCNECSLLWETLTGREHLLFYGRLKNLKGDELLKVQFSMSICAVDDSLKSVNLFHRGVGDKQVGKYSGGMKRRLSVAISLIGDPKLKARYGGTYVLTMTTSSENEQEVEQLVHRLSPNASRIYHISGTQKFELPKQELRIADVFHAVESAKSRFSIYAWGLVDTTLEDVFIKVAKGAQAFSVVA